MYVYGRTYPDWEPNLEDAPTFTEDYTVAGIIYSLQDNSRQEEYTEIYIPLCFLFRGVRNFVYFGRCSFVLHSPEEKADFLEESGRQLRELRI